MKFEAKTPEDRCVYDTNAATQRAWWRMIAGTSEFKLVCEGCALVLVHSLNPPYRIEPLPEWTAYVLKEERAKWGRMKRRLHKDQETMDFDA